MPTSNADKTANEPTPRARHRVRDALIIVCVFALANVLLCLALEPYGAHIELVWWDYYRSAQDDLDTIIVGTSNAAYGFNPQLLDEELGSVSFNMATPEQPLDLNLSTIQTVASEHGLKRVILGVGYETMVRRPYFGASVLLVQSKCMGESGPQALADLGHLYLGQTFSGRQESLFGLFPWAYTHVNITPEDISANIYNRLHYSPLEGGMRYLKAIDSNWDYGERGFFAYSGALSQGMVHGTTFTTFADEAFRQENLDELRQICDYCTQHDIALYVVATRYTPSVVLEYDENYRQNMAKAQQVAQDAGATFFDLNMIHRDVFDPELGCYMDYTHLNRFGAQEASELIGRLVQSTEKGEDVSDLFYGYTKEDWKAYCASIDYVDTVDYSYEVTTAGMAVVQANAHTSDSVRVEYRFDRYDAAADAWLTLQDWGVADTCELSRDAGTTQQVRVYARPAGSTDPALERWAEGSVDF